MKNYIKIARPDHWVKQLFIVPGIILAIFVHDIKVFGDGVLQPYLVTLLLGFFSTCFIASANYVINEWLDADFDQHHPTKKLRPVVAVGLKTSIIVAEYIALSIVGLVMAWFANLQVFFMVLFLWVMGVVYNVRPMRTKEVVFVDVLSESINNAIRLLIGWFVFLPHFLPAVSIIIGYWMGGAFLMATKRFAEYRMINDKEKAGLYRHSFKYYTENSLLISAFLYALLAVSFTTIYFVFYRLSLIISLPFMCVLFIYYFLLSYKPDSVVQKPEKLLKEKFLMFVVLLFAIAFVVGLFIDIPYIDAFFNDLNI